MNSEYQTPHPDTHDICLNLRGSGWGIMISENGLFYNE